jgi:hypothetical protein
MFHILFKHRKNRILIFDDTQGLLNNKQTMSLLLSALFTARPSGKRVVEWLTTSKKLKCPPFFQFESKIIIVANDIPSNIAPLVSRCFRYTLRMEYVDKLKLMYEIAKMPHKLSKEERFMVVDWIKDNTCEATADMNLRLQAKIELLYEFNKDKWQELAKSLIELDCDLVIVKDIISTTTSAKEQVRKFIEQTGMSRATFFRLKAELR